MYRIRGGSGLGDSLYLRPIVEHFLTKGPVTICSNHRDVFAGMTCTVEAFRKININVVAHYATRKGIPSTNQWQDICINAGAPDLQLKFDWSIRNQALVDSVRTKANGKKVILIHGGRLPMDRQDGFGKELMPLPRTFDLIRAELAECFLVRIGGGIEVYRVDGDLDLWGKTSIADLIDLGQSCDGIVAPCSFCVPLAEGFDKPYLAVWAMQGMKSAKHAYIRQITPAKVLSKATSKPVIDNATDEQIQGEARAFRLMV